MTAGAGLGRKKQRWPLWRADFPTGWQEDQYVTRRELTKFLTLGSALLAGASAAIAAVGHLKPKGVWPRIRIGAMSSIAPNGSLLFRYPTNDDPCMAIRTPDGVLHAYSQVCTHLSCAVVHRPHQNCLFCPCHEGFFSPETGRPIAGPPTRRLPRILLERSGDDLYAVGREV